MIVVHRGRYGLDGVLSVTVRVWRLSLILEAGMHWIAWRFGVTCEAEFMPGRGHIHPLFLRLDVGPMYALASLHVTHPLTRAERAALRQGMSPELSEGPEYERR